MNGNFFDDWFGSFVTPVATLDKAWRDACITGNFKNYTTMLENIKMGGKKVYRNSKGQHKVV